MKEREMPEESPIDYTLKSIGQHLKLLRIEGGYKSYVQFALEAGIQPKQYWKLEAGTANFTIRTLLRVLEKHQISIQDFFNRMDNQTMSTPNPENK